MPISQTAPFLSEAEQESRIPIAKLSYLRERQRNRLYDFIVSKFLEAENSGRISRAGLARRIGKRPEQITRWLGAPGNWTLDTISDLLVGIFGEELDPKSVSLFDRTPRNFHRPDWFKEIPEIVAPKSGNSAAWTSNSPTQIAA